MIIDNKNEFIHFFEDKVKFHEIDLLGVMNNAVYFNYFEDGRIRYIQNLQKKYNLKQLLHGDSFMIIAHNNADYFEPALMDDEIRVYTRIHFIKNSSFGFRHLIERVKDNKIISQGGGVMVHINFKTKLSQKLPEEFYLAVSDFEKQVEIIRD